MPIHLLRYIPACAFLFLCCILAAAQDIAKAPQPSSTSAAYPESADGLKSLLQDILAAIKSGDAQKTSQLLATLSVPSHKEWFLKSFGPTEGPRLEATWRHDFEPGREHVNPDGSRIIATDRELIYLDAKGLITGRASNGEHAFQLVGLERRLGLTVPVPIEVTDAKRPTHSPMMSRRAGQLRRR